MPHLDSGAVRREDAWMDIPETRYAKTADGVHIAYQVVGDGPIDICSSLGWITHIERMWTEPRLARLLTRLASFSRVMMFDKRGVGLSDRVPEDRLPIARGADGRRASRDGRRGLRASGRARRLRGWPDGHDVRRDVSGANDRAVLFGTSACWNDAPDYRSARPKGADDIEAFRDRRERLWGTKELARRSSRDSSAPHAWPTMTGR